MRVPNKPALTRGQDEAQDKRVVMGTDADLRKLSLANAKQYLIDFGIPNNEVGGRLFAICCDIYAQEAPCLLRDLINVTVNIACIRNLIIGIKSVTSFVEINVSIFQCFKLQYR